MDTFEDLDKLMLILVVGLNPLNSRNSGESARVLLRVKSQMEVGWMIAE